MKKLFKLLVLFIVVDVIAYLVWRQVKSQGGEEADLSPMAFCRDMCELMGMSCSCSSEEAAGEETA